MARMLGLMNGRAIGFGFAAFLVPYVLGLLIIGGDPSDAEMHLATWPALVVGFGVTMRVTLRSSPPPEDK
jgi:hypothetical protein